MGRRNGDHGFDFAGRRLLSVILLIVSLSFSRCCSTNPSKIFVDSSCDFLVSSVSWLPWLNTLDAFSLSISRNVKPAFDVDGPAPTPSSNECASEPW